jgi:hypothetical protein
MAIIILRDGHGTPPAILIIIKDITEHIQADELLRESKLKCCQAMLTFLFTLFFNRYCNTYEQVLSTYGAE